jgi:hypothetical protein
MRVIMRVIAGALFLFAVLLSALQLPASAATVTGVVTSMGGEWAWGNTGYNAIVELGSVDNTADLPIVSNMLAGPYVHQPIGSPNANGIYKYPTGPWSLVFSLPSLSIVDSISILSSRSYSNTTNVIIDYSIDGGVTWLNVVTGTTGSLGWPLVISTDIAFLVTLDLFEITANQIRLSFVGGNQVSIHSVTFDVTATPLPGALVLFASALSGLGLFSWLRSRNS